MRIMSVNINAAGLGAGIQSKESRIHDFIAETKPDVLFLLEVDTENYVVHESFKVTGYKQFTSDPSPVGQNNTLKTRVVCLINFKAAKSSRQIKTGVKNRAEVWVELKLNNGSKLITAGIYREWINNKPGRDNDSLMAMMSGMAKRKLIILGDHNTCVVKGLEKPESKQGQYLDDIQQLGLRVIEDGYTFYRGGADGKMIKSGLDWGATNVDNVTLTKRWTGFSDHAAVGVDVDGKEARQRTLRKGRNKDKLYSKESQLGLAEREWDKIYMAGDVNSEMEVAGLAARLTAMVLEHRDRIAPEKRRWVTDGFELKSTPKLVSIQRAISKAIREERFEAVRRLKRRYRNVSRQKKMQYANNLMARDGPGAIWSLLKDVTEPERGAIDIVENAITLTARQAAERFLVYFDEKVRKLRARADPDGRVPQNRGENNEQKFSFSPVTEKDVLKKISRMRSTGSADNLGLSQVDLKKLARAIVTPLTRIINISMSTGIYPEIWKVARVVPCPKSGKDHTKVDGFRPLSMLSPFGKLCELVVKDQLQEYATNTKFIPLSQHGYQKNKGCDTAIGQAMRIIDEKVKRGKRCAIVVYDYSAAFDLVDARLLDDKLRLMGCSRTVRKWVRSYLSDRTIMVDINGEQSRKIILEFGSPQGSILSPLLFIILIADMECNMPGVMIGYCDDSTNIIDGDGMEDLKKGCEDSIKKMGEYASMMGLCLNVGKTELMAFGRQSMGTLEVNGERIEEASEIKFLGTWISKKRSMRTHVDKTVPKLNAKIGVLRRVLNVLPKQARAKIAVATVGGVIQSSLLSAIDPIYKKGDQQIKRLQRIYNSAARLTLRKRRRDQTSTDELMSAMGTESVRKSATVRLMKAAYQIYSEGGNMKYLAGMDGDEKVAKRNRRGANARLLPEWKEGQSLTCKARGAWNTLERCGLSHLKESDTIKVFEKGVRDNYNKIWESIQAEWAEKY